VMLAAPLLVMVLARRSLRGQGLRIGHPSYHLGVGFTAAVPYSCAYAAAQALPSAMGPWAQAAAQATLTLAALGAAVAMLRKKPTFEGLPVVWALLPLAGVGMPDVGRAASALAFYTLFLSTGEEILFRGYIQSRLNAAFGRPFDLSGVRWGWGLLIASAFFAALHVLNLPALATGEVSLLWPRAIPTFVGGLFFGYLREKTGSVAAGTLVHGLPQGIAVAFLGM